MAEINALPLRADFDDPVALMCPVSRAGDAPSKPDGHHRTYSDLLTLLYQMTLMKLPQQTLLEFWTVRQPPRFTTTSVDATLEALTSSRVLLPSSYVFQVTADAERLFCQHGMSMGELMEWAITHLRNGHMLPMNLVARGMAASLARLKSGELRRGFLRAACCTVRINSPDATLSILSEQSHPQWNRDHVLTSPDASMRHRFPPWDLHGVFGTVLRHNPRIFGCRPFEQVRPVCHMRSLEEALAAHEGTLPSQTCGTEMPLESFLSERQLPMPKNVHPDSMVQVADTTRKCARCGAQVLEEGVAYRAPFALIDVKYTARQRSLTQGLLHLVRTATEQPPELKDCMLRHQALIEELRAGRALALFFDGAREHLYCDGHLVTRGVTARMLHFMLTELEGASEGVFARQQLIAAGRLDVANPSFEVRIRRLVCALEAKCPAIRLSRAGRGLWRLEAERCYALSATNLD